MNKFDFKYIIKRVIIGLAIGFILFNVNKCNAYALVYKSNIGQEPHFNTRWFGGNITGNGGYVRIDFELNQALTVNHDYDLIAIQISQFDVRYESGITLTGSGTYCSTYRIDHYYPSSSTDPMIYNQMVCTSATGNNNLSGTITNQGDVWYYYAVAEDSNQKRVAVIFSSDQENTILIPVKDIDNLKKVVFYIRNHSLSSLYYSLEIENVKSYYNYDSTEIVNALEAMTQEQQETNSIITDPSTSQSTTSGQNFLTNGQSAISNKFEQATSYNQFMGILNNFLSQMSNSTCQPINLPIPYTQETLVLPCLGNEFTQRIPALWTLYKLIITGALGLVLWKYFIGFIKSIMDPYNIGATNLPIGGGK